MKKGFCIFFFSSLLLAHNTFSQCGSLNISITDETCLNQTFSPINNSTGLTTYVWDFCAGDMQNLPSATTVNNYASIGRSDGIDIIRENADYYGFMITSSGNLIRLDFGSSLSNQPVINNLGFVIQGYDISMVKDTGNVWHAYIATTNSKVYRVDFDSGITGSITINDLGNFGGNIASPRGIRTLKVGNDIYAFATSSTNKTVTVMQFQGG